MFKVYKLACVVLESDITLKMIFTKCCVLFVIIFMIQHEPLLCEDVEQVEHGKLVTQWKQVSSFKSGYKTEELGPDFSSLSNEQLRENISLRFDLLKCGHQQIPIVFAFARGFGHLECIESNDELLYKVSQKQWVARITHVWQS